ncbi:HEPN domain-containing protein [Vibrio splendidus]|nr:HEPN domain-containing protein [Vibrio splendidus]MCC4880322.1 hypothetical protein [Vibrio splendidus]
MKLTTEIKLAINKIIKKLSGEQYNYCSATTRELGLDSNKIPDTLTIHRDILIRDISGFDYIELITTKEVRDMIYDLSHSVVGKSKIYCYPDDIVCYMDNLILYVINSKSSLFRAYFNNDNLHEFNCDIDSIFKLTLQKIRKEILHKRRFSFPLHMVGLSKGFKLSSFARIKVANESLLSPEYQKAYLFGRHSIFNALLEIDVDVRASYNMGCYLAQRAARIISGIVNMHATQYNNDLPPFILSEDKAPPVFDFLLHSFCNSEEIPSYKRSFFHNNELKYFWLQLEDRVGDRYFLILMNIVKLSFRPLDEKKRVCDIIINSILWFNDALKDGGKHSRIVKVVTSLECLVNFNNENDKLKDSFIKRIVALTPSKHPFHDCVESQSNDIYLARSTIVHGSIYRRELGFCPLIYARSVIIFTVINYDKYGLEKTSFNKSLPKYIDSIES